GRGVVRPDGFQQLDWTPSLVPFFGASGHAHRFVAGSPFARERDFAEPRPPRSARSPLPGSGRDGALDGRSSPLSVERRSTSADRKTRPAGVSQTLIGRMIPPRQGRGDQPKAG